METWRDIPGYKGLYQVSSLGRVKSMKRFRICGRGGKQPLPEKIRLVGTDPKTHYHSVLLCKNSIRKGFLVHRLVALAFIPNPKGKAQVNHKDGDKSNNRIENLEWVTCKENHKHAHENGLGLKGSQVGTSKYTESIVKGIIHDLVSGLIPTEAARNAGVKPNIVYGIVYGTSWKHVPKPSNLKEVVKDNRRLRRIAKRKAKT